MTEISLWISLPNIRFTVWENLGKNAREIRTHVQDSLRSGNSFLPLNYENSDDDEWNNINQIQTRKMVILRKNLQPTIPNAIIDQRKSYFGSPGYQPGCVNIFKRNRDFLSNR